MRFQVLGPVAAYGERGPVALGSARQRTVLAVLLTQPGTAVSFDQLVDRVWGMAAPQRVRQTLHTYLSRLRGVLGDAGGPVLARRSRSYALEADPAVVDLHRFRALAAEARWATDDDRAASLWCDALALWQGGVPFADLDSDWLRAVAVGLEPERLAAMLDCNDVLLRRGEHAQLLPELSAAAVEHPLDERLSGQLMLALYRCGRQADALAHYRLLHKRLVEEVGSDPSPVLQQLHQRVLRQDLEFAATVPVVVADPPADSGIAAGDADAPAVLRAPAVGPLAQLPADVAGFTGRVVALRQLDALLAPAGEGPSTVVITAIGGFAGVGKTALAVHWAHRVRDRFPDGQLYLNLRGFDPAGHAMSVAEALRVLLELLGVPPERIPASVQAQAGLYRSRLAGARMLVVLDNARDADQVRPLLPGEPGSLVVVTSRDQLAGLVAAEGARPVRLDVLGDIEARLLLAGRLGAGRVAAEPDAVDGIVAACAGLPLALAIVAARAVARAGFGLAVFAGELADARGRLDVLAGPDAATDVRAVFSWSYDALSPAAARLFRLLGLHPGPDVGLRAVASLAGVPVPQARGLLAELTAAHLLTEHLPGRFIFHDLLRAYAAELAATDPDRPAGMLRLLDHYVYTGLRAAQLINPYRIPLEPTQAQPGTMPEELSTREDAFAWFSNDREVLLAAIDRAAGSGHDAHCWQLVWAVADFLDRRGQWHDLLVILPAGLAAACRHGDRTMQARSHQGLGLLYFNLGRYPQAATHGEEAIALHGGAGDPRGLMLAHLTLKHVYAKLGRYRVALRHAQLAVEAAQAAGDRLGQSGCLSGIGWLHAQFGDYHECIAYAEQALAVLTDKSHRFHAAIWYDFGYAHQHLGQYLQAVTSYQRAVALYRELGIGYREAESLTGLADSYDAIGEHAAAREARQRALEIFDEIGHPDTDELRKRLE